MSGSVNIGGTWKNVSGMSVNIGGTWKSVSTGYVNIAGTWKTFYSASNTVSSIEYLIVNGGSTSSGYTGGNGGFFKTGSLSVSLGTSQTVTVGAAGSNSSLTSVSAPTNYNGTSRSAGSTNGGYVGYTGDGCTYYGLSFSAYGGGAGASSNGQNGIFSVQYSSVYWQGGSGGASATNFLVSHSGGGGGYINPTAASWYNYCYYYSQTTYGYAGNNGGGTYGRGGTNGSGTAGVIVIRYPDTYDDLTSSTGTKTTTGGYKYYTFTSTGSFTV